MKTVHLPRCGHPRRDPDLLAVVRPVQAPSHGFARIMQWEFTAHNENEEGVFLTFTLRDSAETRKLWPHEFTLIARIRPGDTCEVELEAYGQYQATAALHTYFTVGDIAQVSISGLGQHLLDNLSQREEYTEETKLVFNGRTDRIYTEPEQSTYIHDKKLKRHIEVVHFHHSDVVCWNPVQHCPLQWPICRMMAIKRWCVLKVRGLTALWLRRAINRPISPSVYA